MKEYKLDKQSLMGAWYIPKKLCDNIIKKMNNNKLVPGMMYSHSKQVIDKTAKESFEMAVSFMPVLGPAANKLVSRPWYLLPSYSFFLLLDALIFRLISLSRCCSPRSLLVEE